MAQTIARFNPFSELQALRRDLFDDGFARGLRRVDRPITDVYTEGDNALIVEAHLPHFEDKDITVSVDGGRLTIQAERHEKEEDKRKKYVVRESSSSYYHTIALPEQAHEEGITAGFDDGLLKVVVPLTGATTSRKIAITGGG